MTLSLIHLVLAHSGEVLHLCLQVDSLAFLWISHKHADHMLGLPGILAARSAARPPLLVSHAMQGHVHPLVVLFGCQCAAHERCICTPCALVASHMT